MNRPTSKPLGDLLRDLVGDLGIGPKLREYDAVVRWNEAVGPHIAAVTEPKHIRKGVLVVRVSNATWRYELSLRKKEIIQKLNTLLGENLVRDIKVQ